MPISKISRRSLMSAGVATTAMAGLANAGDSKKSITPPQTEGPFYPVKPQDDKDADLTRIGDNNDVAVGAVVVVEGHVYGPDGKSIADAVVDIWQANAHGRYAHEADPNPAPLDPNFQGWAIIKTNARGMYRYKTIIPGAYPVDDEWSRPPHIHYKVSRRGFREITTQMYFEGQPLNDVDRLLNDMDEKERQTLIAKSDILEGDADTAILYRFDVVLAKV